MSGYDRVVWTEGMFLRPHHFQQQDRCFDYGLRQSLMMRRSHGWGLRRLEIDQGLLQTGKLSILVCEGLMPDGTIFNAPLDHEVPPPREVPSDLRNCLVYLALPVESRSAVTDAGGPMSNGGGRFTLKDIEILDVAANSLGSRAEIIVGRLQLSLVFEGEQLDGKHLIPLTRIVEVAGDSSVILDDQFIPSCIDYRASRHLVQFMSELHGSLHQRGEQLAGWVSASGRATVAQVTDVLLLQVVNGAEPVVAHLCEGPVATAKIRATGQAQDAGDQPKHYGGLHPEELFRFFVSLAGELATHTSETRRPPAFPPYRHDKLLDTFLPVERELLRSLSWFREQPATAIKFEELRYGIHRAVSQDFRLLKDAVFVLAVAADMDAERLSRLFRAQTKVGPQDRIRDLVTSAVPGIGLQTCNQPRQIPYRVGSVYFQVETKGELWAEVQRTGILCLQVAGEFPNLELTLWALTR